MLSACDTFHYYRDALRERIWEKDPAMLALVLAQYDTWFSDYPVLAAEFVRGLMRQRSRDVTLTVLDKVSMQHHTRHHLDDDLKPLFVGDGFFDETYSGRSRPKRKDPGEPWVGFPY
jgi:hypothetical protein